MKLPPLHSSTLVKCRLPVLALPWKQDVDLPWLGRVFFPESVQKGSRRSDLESDRLWNEVETLSDLSLGSVRYDLSLRCLDTRLLTYINKWRFKHHYTILRYLLIVWDEKTTLEPWTLFRNLKRPELKVNFLLIYTRNSKKGRVYWEF